MQLNATYLQYFSHMNGFCTRSMLWILKPSFIVRLNNCSTVLYSSTCEDNETRSYCELGGMAEDQLLGINLYFALLLRICSLRQESPFLLQKKKYLF